MASRSMKNRPGIKKKHPMVGLLTVLAVLMALVLCGAIGAYSLGSVWLEDLPEYSDSSAYNSAQKTEVYAGDGTTLLAEFYIENREPIALDQISEYVKHGTVATEDERFYEHNGVDLWGVARALVVNASGSSREGASTITQQFVRATVLSEEANDISYKRKVREMYISLKLEEMFSKDEILLMYLNTINYGSGAYGIEAAAHTYFSKSANDLTLVEAATLVGIPQSPTYNNPIDNPNDCLTRRNHVLSRMLSNGYISQEEYDAAVVEPINLVLENKGDSGIYLYPYFTSYVRDALLEQFSEAEVFKGGLKVYTTIDPNVQALAEDAARDKEAYMAEDIEVAITAIDPNTGFIKAMVGGKDFSIDQYNLATQAKRSCGSAFKIFTLVAALEEGISPSTSISCSSRVKIGNWDVENYGGSEYGTRTIAGAFAVSSNTAFARLISVLGPDKVAEVAHRMGIKSDIPSAPAITLGSVGVSTDEMAGSIATVANGGTHHEVTGIAKIVDRNGDTIYEADTTGERVISEEIAYAAREVMKGVVSYGTGTAAQLYNGQPVIGKTGTAEDWTDSYFIGSTPEMSVAVWIGARDQRKMNTSNRAVGVFGSFMNNLVKGQDVVYFPEGNNPVYTTFSSSSLNIGTPSYGYTKPKEEKPEEETKEETKEETPKAKTPTEDKTDKPTKPTNPDSGGSTGGDSGGSSGSGGTSDTGGKSDSGSGSGSDSGSGSGASSGKKDAAATKGSTGG